MSIRLKCQSCRAAFLVSDESVGRIVACPKCGDKQKAPSSVLISPPSAEEATVFVPADTDGKRGGRSGVRWILALVVVASLAVGGVVAWPKIRGWLNPVPPDPIEVVASKFLSALIAGDAESLGRTSTLSEPPAIRAVQSVQHQKERDQRLMGPFRPIAELHTRIQEKYEYDPAIGRFKTLNPLGPAAETLDVLHDENTKKEAQEIAKKIESGSPDDLFDAAEKLGQTFNKLAEGALAPKKLLPTYQQLVLDSRPQLPPMELELALDFAKNRESWDTLLKRSFPSLKSDGPYVFERAEVVAQVTDHLASSGDPPTELRLKLVRFRLEGIDTSWKVVSARRTGQPEPNAKPREPQSPETQSPSQHEAPR